MTYVAWRTGGEFTPRWHRAYGEQTACGMTLWGLIDRRDIIPYGDSECVRCFPLGTMEETPQEHLRNGIAILMAAAGAFLKSEPVTVQRQDWDAALARFWKAVHQLERTP